MWGRRGVDNPASGKFWINNGTITKMIKGDIPEGFQIGRGLKNG